jgi:hypothetical protein
MPGAGEEAGSGRAPFSWEALAALVIHPAKVAILEALLWIELPLSAKQLADSFDYEEYYPGIVSHHVNHLARLGVLEVVSWEAVEGTGACEKFFGFAEASR